MEEGEAQEKGSEVALLYSSIQPSESSAAYASCKDAQESLSTLLIAVGAVLPLTGIVAFVLILTKQARH